MKRAIVLVALAAVAAVGGALAYRSAVRDRSYRLLVASGEAALSARETLAAVEDFSGAIAVRPDAMLAHQRRGETYRLRGDLDLAARDFRAAAALDPTATRPIESLGDVLFAQGRYKRAAESYEARLRLDDRSPHVRYKLALARYRDGAVLQALIEARRAIAADDQLADAHYLVALCLRERNRPDEAIAALREALTRAPGLIPAREELIDLLGQAQREGERLEQLQVLSSLDAGHAERQVAVALAHARDGSPDLAVLTLSGLLARPADQPLVWAAMGRVWLQVAEDHRDRADALAHALESLERAASSLGATSEVKALYGRALALSGQLEAAEQLFQQATERFPVDPRALRQLADVAERLRHPQVARTALIGYAALVPSDDESAAQAARIGALSLTLDDPATALPWLARAVSRRPDDVAALAALADAQLRLGHSTESRNTVQRGLAIDPKSRSLLALRKRLGMP